MTLNELTIWCHENPRTAASRIQQLETEVAHLNEMLNPTNVDDSEDECIG